MQSVKDGLFMNPGSQPTGFTFYKNIESAKVCGGPTALVIGCSNMGVLAQSRLPVEVCRISYLWDPSLKCFVKGSWTPIFLTGCYWLSGSCKQTPIMYHTAKTAKLLRWLHLHTIMFKCLLILWQPSLLQFPPPAITMSYMHINMMH